VPKFEPKIVIKKLPLVGLCESTIEDERMGASYEKQLAIEPGSPATDTTMALLQPTFAGMIQEIAV
jgi:hypothetical protein